MKKLVNKLYVNANAKINNIKNGIMSRKEPGVDGIVIAIALVVVGVVACVFFSEEILDFIGSFMGKAEGSVDAIF